MPPPRSKWRPYVSVAERRQQAARTTRGWKKSGRELSPVIIEGRTIATTFWGKAWCDNLEAYSDYENRLPRGRTYARRGSVLDLRVEREVVRSMVMGSTLYEVEIRIAPLPAARWRAIKKRSAGKIESVLELLQGRLSKEVMSIVSAKGEGLFPAPKDISLSCSCPDWASMCKHVAATLYGVGARLDSQPELLFTLRGADPAELVDAAVAEPHAFAKPSRRRTLAVDELSAVFGVDLILDLPTTVREPRAASTKRPRKKKAAKKKASAKKKPAKK